MNDKVKTETLTIAASNEIEYIIKMVAFGEGEDFYTHERVKRLPGLFSQTKGNSVELMGNLLLLAKVINYLKALEDSIVKAGIKNSTIGTSNLKKLIRFYQETAEKFEEFV